MASFRYIAVDAAGQRQGGDIEAGDLDGARRQLAERGWRVESIEPATASVRTGSLSSEEATQLGAQLAELVGVQMPLPEGLRAVSRELAPGRLSRSLEQLAGELAKGRPVPEALAECGAAFPAHLRGLMAAGIRSGRLGEALQRFVALERHGQQMRREMWSVLSYPIVLLVMLSVLGVAIAQFLLPLFGAILNGYHVEMPWMALVGQWVFGPGMCCAGGLVVMLLIIRLFGGHRVWHAMRRRVPLLGPLFYFQAIRDFAQLLSILLGEGVPLPEALRLTARGVRDATSSAAADGLAVAVEQGASFGDALATRRARPLSVLGPLAQWSEEQNVLPKALDATAAMYAGRADLQLDMLRISLPPIVFLVIFVGGLLLFSAFWSAATAFLHLLGSLSS